MRKTLVCLALFCIFTISLADDCQNPLFASLFPGLTSSVSAGPGTGLKFCKSLQNAQTCCSAEIIQGIQNKVDTLTDRLKTAVISRDKTITDARDQVIPAITASLKNLQDSMTKMASNPQFAAALASSPTMSGMTGAIDQLGKQSGVDSAALKKGFGDFQKSRTSCVVEVVKLQSAAYCLACDPTYASKGVSAGADVTLSDKVCKRLGAACYPFIATSVAQSQLLKVKSMATMINALSDAFTKMANNDVAGGMTALTSAFASMANGAGGAAEPTSPTAPIMLPAGCTSATQCNWLCSNLLVKGKLDETSLILGGVADTSSPLAAMGGRLLEEEEVSVVKSKLAKNRQLAGSEWDPESDEAGVTVTFQDDPAGVKPADDAYGSRIGGGFICMIALLVAYLF